MIIAKAAKSKDKIKSKASDALLFIFGY